MIIEQGKILRAGSLEQIIAHDSPLRTIAICAAGSPEALHKELLQLPFVHDVRTLGEEVEIQVDGDDESNIAIRTHLVGKGFRIIDFRQRQMDLEDVFMTVTKGEVQ